MTSICHVTVGLGMGGIEQLLVDLVARGDPSRFSHTVCCLVRGGPREEQLRELGAPVHHVRGASASDPRTLFRLARLLRRLRPDILHIHCPIHSSWAVPAGLLGGVPRIVATIHSTYWHQGLKLRFVQALSLLQGRWINRTVAISDAVAEYACREKCALPDRIVVIHNGIDLARFDANRIRPRLRCELGLGEHVRIIGVVGGLRPEKGHRYLLDAFADVRKLHPDAHLILIGEGSLRPALEEKAREDGVTSYVHFMGRRTDVELDMLDFDLFVLPSVVEGFGLVLVEAMALGLPIVATDLPGIAEVVGPDGAAVLVPPKDPPTLARAVDELLTLPERARRMGDVGRTRSERFSVERTVAGVEAVYTEVIADRPRAGEGAV